MTNIMKNPLYELIARIVLEVLQDLLDDGKLNGSFKKLDKPTRVD